MANDKRISKDRANESSSADSSSAPTGRFVRSGSYWTIAYGGLTFSVKDMKGIAYIHRLLQRPYEKFHALDLLGWQTAGAGSEICGPEKSALPTGVSIGGLGDAGPMLDTQAKREYRRRLHELKEELEELRKRGDTERGEKVEAEIDFIEREIIRAVGLGGRDRRTGSAAERARLNVTRTIKIALQKISEQHAGLGELLETSIKTGLFSAYIPHPANAVSWQSSLESAEPLGRPQASAPVVAGFADAPLDALSQQSALVGREAESAVLRRHLNQVRRGEGSVVLIGGTAGVGKTRIARELGVEAAQAGIPTLVGHCYDREDPVPFVPFVEILEAALERAPNHESFRALLGADAAEISRLLPQLRRLFSDIPAVMDLAPAQSQRMLFNAVGELLTRMAAGKPLLLLLEDLHWADQGTLSLLNHLARWVHKIPVLIAGNYRDNELDSNGSLAHTLEELIRLGLVEQVSLRGLPENAVAEMIRSLGESEPSPALVGLLHKTTDGNPFFVGELFRHLAERGRLSDFDDQVRAELRSDQLVLPQSLRLVIGRRVNRVSDETRSVLAAAAVVGRSFPFALLQAATRTDPDALLDRVEEAEKAGLISSELVHHDAQFKFAHELIRRVVLDELSAVRRQRLHLSVAEAIEALHPDTADDHVGDLAHHLWNAGTAAEVAKTVRYLQTAGKKAVQSGALKEAEIYFKQAIAALSATPERIEREFDLQCALWQVLSITRGSGTGEGVQATRRLQELGEKIGNPEQLIRALWSAWNSTSGRGDMNGAQQIAEQLMEMAQRSGSRFGLSMAHMLQGIFFHYYRGDLIQAKQHYEAAIASYSETEFLGDIWNPHVRGLSQIGLVLWHLGSADQAQAKIRESISLSERLKSPLGGALYLAGVLYIHLREPGKAQEVAERLFSLASEQQSAFVDDASVCRGWAIAEQGRTDEGIALIRAGLDSYVTLGFRLDTFTLRLLSEAQARAGQLEEALATIQQAFPVVGELQITLPSVLWWRGELHLKRGDETLADRDFRQAVTAARRIGSKAYELRATTSLARLLAIKGNRDEARRILAEIYNGFTEGFDTADLKDAKALLEELSI